jgi:CheY-like chemotaxis protein
MGVLHRDLKPENIFLAQVGGLALHPTIVDFGLAKVHDDRRRLDRTDQSQVMGTPYYMSLEQVENPSDVDARTDQYALGVIAYEALTKRRPFDGDVPIVVLAEVVTGKLVPPRAIVPTISPGLEAIVLRAMARHRDDRFPTIRELAAALLPHASHKARVHWASAFGQASVAPPPMEAEARPTRVGPACILVIEDEEAIRENLVELLELEGFAVKSAESGTDGLALARGGDVDLVLCDITLPGISGHDVLRAIRADAATADLSFVFLTGLAERSHVREGMKLGADDYLTKPFSRDELLDAIRTRLARSAARESAVPPMAAPRVPATHAPTILIDSGETDIEPPPKR